MVASRGSAPIWSGRCATPFESQRHVAVALAGGDSDGDPRFYGRRRGRRLRPRRRRLIDEALPRLALAAPADGIVDPGGQFGFTPKDVWLEIGFGAGEHLAWQATRNPGVGFIGAEPFVNGVARLLARIEDEGLGNIRIVADDVRPVLARLPAACLGRVFVLFPDPWPKPRHHRRRIVCREVLDQLAGLMRDGAELRLATDDEDYLCWILEHLLAHPAFVWLAAGADDWRQRPLDWPATRYEVKTAAAGRRASYLRFARRQR